MLTPHAAGVERLGCRLSCNFMLSNASTADVRRMSGAAVESAGDKREDDLSYIRWGAVAV